MGDELSSGQLDGQELLPDPLPLGPRLEARFLRQVRLLPADTQILLLCVAADATGDAELLLRGASNLGLSAGAVGRCRRARRIFVQVPLQSVIR